MLCCKTKQAKNVPVTAIKAVAEGLEKQLGVAVLYGTLPLKPDRSAVEVWSDVSEEKLQKEAAKQTELNTRIAQSRDEELTHRELKMKSAMQAQQITELTKMVQRFGDPQHAEMEE